MTDYNQTRDAAGKVTSRYFQMLESLEDDDGLFPPFREWFYQTRDDPTHKPVVDFDWKTSDFTGWMENMIEYAYKEGYRQGVKDSGDK